MFAPHALVIEPDDLEFSLISDSLNSFQSHQQLPMLRIKRVRFLSEAQKELSEAPFDVIITEGSLPDSFGQETIESLRKSSPDAFIVVLTLDERGRANWIKWGADDIVHKDILELLLGKTVALHLMLVHESRSVAEKDLFGLPQIFDKSSQAIIHADSEGSILYSNPAARELLLEEFQCNPRKLPCKVPLSGCRTEIQNDEASFELVKLSDFMGQKAECIYLLRDISESKNRARQLRHYVMELESHNLALEERLRVKEEEMEALKCKSATRDLLFASLSHEIRTPLTSVIGYTDMLLAGSHLDSKHASALHAILKNGNYLLELLNNVMDFAKLESGKIELDVQPHSVFVLLTEIEKVLRVRAEAKGIDLRVEYEFPLPEKLFVDGMRLKQILINLVGNAIKFTYRGEVLITVKFDATRDAVVFDVLDTGIGVPEKTQERLFELFHQGQQRPGIGRGFGLGLYLSQGLARCLGSSIQLLRTSSKGSLFSFSIQISPEHQVRMLDRLPPLDLLARDYGNNLAPHILTGTVLLAEDAPDARHLVAALLKDAGVEVFTVSNGQKAIEFLEKREVDLVLMDMQMPIMSGREAIRILRWKNFKKPIVAFTAENTRGGMSLSEIQCEAILAKPFARQDLYAVVGRFLNRRQGSSERLDAMVEKKSQTPEKSAMLRIPKYLLEIEEGPEIFNTFLQQTRRRMDQIRKAQKLNDVESCRKITHQMKASGAFGFKELGQRAGELHSRLCEKKRYDKTADTLIEKLEQAALTVLTLQSEIPADSVK